MTGRNGEMWGAKRSGSIYTEVTEVRKGDGEKEKIFNNEFSILNIQEENEGGEGAGIFTQRFTRLWRGNGGNGGK